MKRTLPFLLLVGLLFGCQDDKLEGDPSSPKNQRINQFTKEKMQDIYFWAEEVGDKKPSLDLEPETFFEAMKYSSDEWSHISAPRDAGEVSDADGYDDGFGYHLSFWGDNGFIFAEVNFVYPNTPAAKAGIQRGDLITRMNGSKLTASNFTDLYYANNLSVGISNTIYADPSKTITLTAQKTEINPILFDNVYTVAGKQIGYMVYTDFADKNGVSLNQLDDVFQKFKSKNVTEFILDLRYNPGGYNTAARHLCSLFAPEADVNGEKQIISKIWNTKYQKLYSGNTTLLEEHFDKTVPSTSRLGLNRLYVLTSRHTASASEMLISGLSPYMEVNMIGDTTTGKNMGGITFTPEETDLKEWNITLITLEYKNSRGESVKGGIIPKREYLLREQIPHRNTLGDVTEPLLAKALGLIGNQRSFRAATVDTPTMKQLFPKKNLKESILLLKK